MTCKDCIHHDVCQYGDLVNCEGCFDFKNKADVQEVKHGEWYVDSPFACSVCDGLSEHKHDYCPHCGAKMDEAGE